MRHLLSLCLAIAIFAQALVAAHSARCDEPAVDGQGSQPKEASKLDSDPKINAVMERFDLTGPITDPTQREHLLMIHKLMTTQQRQKPGTEKLRTIIPPLPKEGHLGVNTRLENPEDQEQAAAAIVLAKQPMPIERLVHWAPLLPRVLVEGWFLQIQEASLYDGVVTVKARWSPIVLAGGRADVANSDYTETWKIRGKEAVLVKGEATVEPALSHDYDRMPPPPPPIPENRD